MMMTPSRFILALILLVTINGCAGADVDSEAPVAIAPQPIEVAPTQPKTHSDTSTGTSSPGSEALPVSPSQTPSSPSQAPSASASKDADSAVPKPQNVVPKATTDPEPIPKLSPEKEKLVSQITKEEKKKADFITQNSGLTTVNRVLLAQQAMWLISGSFSTDFKALEPNLPIETDEYQFKITQGDQSEAVVMAIAKSDKLPSFAGTAVAVPTKTPKIGLCQTKLPSQKAPTPPKINQGKVQCGNDGVIVANVNS